MGIYNAAVTAISDPHEEQHGWARNTLGDRASGVTEFTDHRDLLSSGLVDAVLVAAPNFTHKSLLDDIFETNIPVLVEKPMELLRQHIKPGEVYRRSDLEYFSSAID